MNKSVVKVSAIVGACFIAVGAVCMLIARIIGGTSNLVMNYGGTTIVINDGDCISETMELEPFTDLTVDTAAISVELIQGDSYELETYVPEELKPVVTQKNGKLMVKQPKNNLNISIRGNDMPYYRITVPTEDVIKTSLDLTSGEVYVADVNISGEIDLTSGGVVASGITSDILEIDTTSGTHEITDCKVDTLKLDSTSGDVDISNVEADSISIDGTSGSRELDNVKTGVLTVETTSGSVHGRAITVDKINIDATSGSTELSLVGEETDYDYEIDCVSGNVRIGDSKIAGGYETENGHGKIITVDSTSGNVEIDFE